MMMKIRFYLDTTLPVKSGNAGGPVKGAALVQKVVNHFREEEAKEHYFSRYSGESVNGLHFHKDERGLYVEADHFLDGLPSQYAEAELPFSLVTMYDQGTTGQPQFGIYELCGSNAIVDPYENRRRVGGGGGLSDEQLYVDEPGWRIRIHGPSLESVVHLYRQFRSGQVKPTEVWDDLALVIKEQNAEIQKAIEELKSLVKEHSEAATASN